MPMLGVVYTVRAVDRASRPFGIRLVEIVNQVCRYWRRDSDRVRWGEVWYHPRRFRRLERDIEVFRQILREASPESELVERLRPVAGRALATA